MGKESLKEYGVAGHPEGIILKRRLHLPTCLSFPTYETGPETTWKTYMAKKIAVVGICNVLHRHILKMFLYPAALFGDALGGRDQLAEIGC